MRGTVDVLAVLLPEVHGDEAAAALLTAEAERIATALGGGMAGVRFSGGEHLRAAAYLDRLVGYVASARPRIVLMLDGDMSRELAPLLASRLGSEAIIGCTGVVVAEGAASYLKPVYGGWLEAEIGYRQNALEVVTLARGFLPDPTEGPLGVGEGREERVVEVAVSGDRESVASDLALDAPDRGSETANLVLGGDIAARLPGIERLELHPPEYHSVDIVHAVKIVAAGMGVAEPGGDEEQRTAALDHLERLAGLMEGSTAATRPVVDEGLLPKERLVGQTGKTVAPDVYLALGISGSPHHVAGIQGAGTILSVDRDPAAPIFQFSDAGFVGDLREVLPALIRRIEEWRDGE
jgi:electron transfer flavoprotein alpha subunit